MLLKRPVAALVAAVIAALAVSAPALGAPAPGATTTPAAFTSNPNPSCPAWYSGPTNLATGCPYWLMS
jgi:hypothetical protein